ncbi:MAG: hypothetical protein ACI9ES_002068 [Oceanospirillaceae bacterium]|jgi:hypothetical protein
MAKTVQLDRHKVVDKAKDLYWKKGIHATSMRKLIVDTQRDLPNSICMLAKTVTKLTGHNQGLLDEARATLLAVEKHLRH